LQTPPGAHPAPGSRIWSALGLGVQIPLLYRRWNNAWRRIRLSRGHVVLYKTVNVEHINDTSMTKKKENLLAVVPLELATAAGSGYRMER
jgi:hypothetical protein